MSLFGASLLACEAPGTYDLVALRGNFRAGYAAPAARQCRIGRARGSTSP
jgi:hypothetical protein